MTKWPRWRCWSTRPSTRTPCSTTATRPGATRSPAGKRTRRTLTSFPQDQRDPVAAVELLRRLAFGGVRVFSADGARRAGRRRPIRPARWVVPTDQEFAAMARELLDVQKYPDLRQYPGRTSAAAL